MELVSKAATCHSLLMFLTVLYVLHHDTSAERQERLSTEEEFSQFEEQLEREHERQGIEFDPGYDPEYEYVTAITEIPVVPNQILKNLMTEALELIKFGMAVGDVWNQLQIALCNFAVLIPLMLPSLLVQLSIHFVLCFCLPTLPLTALWWTLYLPWPIVTWAPVVYKSPPPLNWAPWTMPASHVQ